MGIEHVRYPEAIVHYSTVDAVFRDEYGVPVLMSFHPFCGPSFEINGADWMPDEDDPVWDQFNGWWNAKGKALYGREPNPDTEVIELELE